jgi:hypothetical protein
MTRPIAMPALTAVTPIAHDALAYRAPFLIEKLLKERIAETPEDAEALFSEVKKFIVLSRSDDTGTWEMYSRRIDETWHQFILFTMQYMDFCQRFFGKYLHHSPSNAPKLETDNLLPVVSFDMFRHRYEEMFGSPLPDLWYDEKSVITQRRVFNDRAGLLTIRNENQLIELISPGGDVLFRVSELAQDALAFVVRTPAFYVRELPADLTDHEKIALIAMLVEYKLLRIG